MADTGRPPTLRHVFDTRASVLAAWFIFGVVIWPILWFIVSGVCLFSVWMVVTTLYPEFTDPDSGIGDLIGLAYGPPIFLVSAVVAAITCYKTCGYLTVPWNEAVPWNQSKPLASEIGTVMAVLIVLTLAFAFWAWLAVP
jgi:hypothetical protein